MTCQAENKCFVRSLQASSFVSFWNKTFPLQIQCIRHNALSPVITINLKFSRSLVFIGIINYFEMVVFYHMETSQSIDLQSKSMSWFLYDTDYVMKELARWIIWRQNYTNSQIKWIYWVCWVNTNLIMQFLKLVIIFRNSWNFVCFFLRHFLGLS